MTRPTAVVALVREKKHSRHGPPRLARDHAGHLWPHFFCIRPRLLPDYGGGFFPFGAGPYIVGFFVTRQRSKSLDFAAKGGGAAAKKSLGTRQVTVGRPLFRGGT